jgi:polysaccharide pyruvyl transferase WcaK-like protein
VPKHLHGRIRGIECPYDQHELKGIIGQCDFFIGSRMHACIAALSQGVPCVGIAYSMKFEGVFESVGMGGWVIDGRTTSNEEAISRVMDLYRQRDKVRESLKVNSEKARDQLNNIFGRLLHTSSNLRVT